MTTAPRSSTWPRSPRPTPGRPRSSTSRRSGVELLVDRVGDLEQVVLADVGRGKRVAELAIDPVEHAYLAFLGIPECGFPVVDRFGAHVQRHACALVALVHEMRHRTAFAGEQTAADQAVANRLQLRRTKRCA